jgi:hypothetical protein
MDGIAEEGADGEGVEGTDSKLGGGGNDTQRDSANRESMDDAPVGEGKRTLKGTVTLKLNPEE